MSEPAVAHEVQDGVGASRDAPAGAPPGGPPDRAGTGAGWTVGLVGLALKGFVLLAALLAFLGLRDGSLDRVLRNYTELSVAVGVLLAVGVVLATVAPQVSARRGRAAVTAGAALLVGLSLLAALVMGVESKDTTDRPQVTAQVTGTDGELSVDFSATAGGLRRTEVLTVVVEGLSAYVPVHSQVTGRFGSRPDSQETAPLKRDPADPTEEYVTRVNYRFVGAGADGVATVEDTVALPPGVYERVRVTASVLSSSEAPGSSGYVRCDRAAERRSCVAVALPPPALAPTLSSQVTDGRTSSVTAAASGLRTTQRLGLRVYEVGDTGQQRLLGALDTAAAASGDATATMPLPVPRAGTWTCVLAWLADQPVAGPQPPVPSAGAPSVPPVDETGPGASAPPADATGSAAGTAAGDGGGLGAPDVPCDEGPATSSLRVYP